MTRLNKGASLLICIGLILLAFSHSNANYLLVNPPIVKACPIKNGHTDRVGFVNFFPSNFKNEDCNSIKSISWNNVQNLAFSDDQYASVQLAPGESSKCLWVGAYNINIPAGSIIKGISFSFEGHVEGGNIEASLVQLTNAQGLPLGTNKNYVKPLNAWQKGSIANDGNWLYGSNIDTWSSTLNTNLLSSSLFGLSIRLRNSSTTNSVIRIDKIHIQVYFEEISRMCMKNCAIFYVTPVVGALDYEWTFPNGSVVISATDNAAEIALNVEALDAGVHEICVRTRSIAGYSDPCCKLFLIDDCRPSKIGNKVWRDDNANGIQDAQEPGLKGIVVHLIDALTKKVIETKYTDDQGRYLFENLLSGNYFLQFGFSPDLYISRPRVGTDSSKDSDLDHSNGLYTTSNIYVAANQSRDDIDVGLYQYSIIGDYVWEDENLNGVQDISEKGVASIPLELYDAQNNLIQTTISDKNGYYTFKNLLAGKYYIKSILTNYLVTREYQGRDSNKDSDFFPNAQTDIFDLPFFSLVDGVDLGLIHAAAVCGQVWFDTNKNGKQDSNEKYVPNKKFYLRDVFNKFVDSTISNSQGEYNFSRLYPNAAYSVLMDVMSDELISVKDAHADDVDSDFNINGVSDLFTANNKLKQDFDIGFTVDCNLATSQLNLVSVSENCYSGNPVSIVFNSSSIIPIDYSEYFILLNSSNSVIVDWSSNSNFSLTDIGNYKIFSLILNSNPNGYYYYDMNSIVKGSSTISNIIDFLNSNNYCYSQSSNELNFTLEQCSSIEGTVWYDYGLEGIWDPVDRVVKDFKVCLLDGNGTIILETQTDVEGKYKFLGLRPSSNYQIKVKADTKYSFTLQDASGFENTDSDVNQNGNSDIFNLPAGSVKVIDAGIHFNCTASAGNISPVQNPDCFYGQAYTLQASINGQVLPAGYRLTYFLVDLRSSRILDVADNSSFAVNAKGVYAIYALVHASDNQDFNYLDLSNIVKGSTNFVQYSSSLVQTRKCFQFSSRPATFNVLECIDISGITWKDFNKNGILEQTEDRFAFVPVRLLDENFNLIEAKLTDANGEYIFEHYQSSKLYIVQFESQGMYAFTIQGSQQIDDDSDVNNFGLSDIINVSSGTKVKINAGYSFNCTVQAADMIEQPLSVNCYSGQVINIAAQPNGLHTLLPDYSVKYLLVSDINASILQVSDIPNFQINNAGRFSIFAFVYNINSGSPDYFDFGQIFVPMLFADFRNIVDKSNKCASLSENPAVFELFTCKGIEGYVWEDYNKDGIQTSDERSLKNVTIYLQDQNGNNIDSTQTDLFGNYMFLNIPVGNYIVKCALNSSFAISPKDIGNDDSKDSDADPNAEINITFLTSSTIINADIGGVREYMKVGNFVWHDVNGDGIQEVQEPGYGGIFMNLVDANNGEVIYTTESSSDPMNLGYYEIPYVPIGNHYIHFLLPDSLCLTKFRVGADSTLDNDFTLINFSWRSREFNTVFNTIRNDIDAGVFFKSTIGNYVWLDENMDGVQDQNEDGLNGVTVSVYNRQGRQIAEILTRFNPDNGKNGFYEFNDFVPGEFYIKFSSPSYNNFTLANSTSDDLDSDVTNLNGDGTTDFFTIVSHTLNTAFDAGYVPNGILGSYLWNDDNGDGIQSEGEKGLANSKIYLYNSDMFMLDSTISDLSGKYHFFVDPGEYILMFDLPQNKIFTKSVSNALLNSDVTGKYGIGSTDMIQVKMYDLKMDIDAGFTSQILLAAEDLNLSGKSYDESNELFIKTNGLIGDIIIERMEDKWVPINDTKPLKVSKGSSILTYTDFFNSDKTEFYYRVRLIAEDNTEIFSNVLHLRKYANSEWGVFPLPFEDKITISIPGEYEIYDINSRLIKSIQCISKNEVIDVTNFASGIYYLQKIGSLGRAMKIVKN